MVGLNPSKYTEVQSLILFVNLLTQLQNILFIKYMSLNTSDKFKLVYWISLLSKYFLIPWLYVSKLGDYIFV